MIKRRYAMFKCSNERKDGKGKEGKSTKCRGGYIVDAEGARRSSKAREVGR